MSNRLDGLVRTRCQRNGCTAEVLLGFSRHGTPVVLDVRTERRAVVQKVVIPHPMTGEAADVGVRVVYHDTYQAHRYSCTGREGGNAATARAEFAEESAS